MVTDDDPANASALSVAVFIALPPVDAAMWAELIVTALFPYALENCTRNLLPPKVA
jgi:hypothetical protein